MTREWRVCARPGCGIEFPLYRPQTYCSKRCRGLEQVRVPADVRQLIQSRRDASLQSLVAATGFSRRVVSRIRAEAC